MRAGWFVMMALASSVVTAASAGAQTVTLRGFGGATFTAKLDGDVSANASGADVFLGQTATFDLDFSQAFETDLDIG